MLFEQLRERREQHLKPVTLICEFHVFFTDLKVMLSIIMSYSKYSFPANFQGNTNDKVVHV